MPSTPEYPYNLRLNIAAWVLQLLACSFFFLVSLLRLSLAGMVFKNRDDPMGFIIKATALFDVSSSFFIIVIDIVEIVKMVRRRMSSALYLTSAILKTLIFVISFLAGLFLGSPANIIVGGVVSVTSIVQLVHGARIARKMRNEAIKDGGEYELVPNPAGAGHLEAGYD